MKVLLDTHVAIFTLRDQSQLPPRVKALIADTTIKKVCSVIIFWEMTIKLATGKLELPEKPENLWRDMRAQDPESLLSIRPQHLARLATLPMHHKDPFDRIMIAQALEEGWSVVSSDEQWDAYGVHRIW